MILAIAEPSVIVMEIYKDDKLDNALQSLDHWSYDAPDITATYEFKDFVGAMGFVNQVALLAEKADHHPDITVSYNKVTISMCTHDADNQITDKDIELAKKIADLG